MEFWILLQIISTKEVTYNLQWIIKTKQKLKIVVQTMQRSWRSRLVPWRLQKAIIVHGCIQVYILIITDINSGKEYTSFSYY